MEGSFGVDIMKLKVVISVSDTLKSKMRKNKGGTVILNCPLLRKAKSFFLYNRKEELSYYIKNIFHRKFHRNFRGRTIKRGLKNIILSVENFNQAYVVNGG